MGVRILRNSFSLSVGLHALFFLLCLLLASQRAAQILPPRTTLIELEPITEQKKNPNNDQVKNQIVQTTPGHVVEKAAPDSFLGEKNQMVDRQTVSRNRTTLMGHNAAPAKNPAKNMAPEKQTRVGSLGKFGLPILPSAKELGQPKQEPTPDWADMGQHGMPQDYVKGIKEGDHTALNTKEFVFFGYYQRIRERLDRAWVPILRERILKLYRMGRRLASDMDHSTRVLVVLNPRGEIVRIQMVTESGIHDLDDAATKAFNEAGPFPNPPKGIIDPNGEIQIPWEFILRT